jgi:hypothetical protein
MNVTVWPDGLEVTATEPGSCRMPGSGCCAAWRIRPV